MISPWIIPVAEMTETVQDGIFLHSDWKSTFCLEEHCCLEVVMSLSRRLQEEIREKEIAQKLAEEKAIQDAIKKSVQQPRRKQK
jgi:hypothetical protein